MDTKQPEALAADIMQLADTYAHARITPACPPEKLPRVLLQNSVEQLMDARNHAHRLLGKANALARIRAERIKELEAQLDSIGAGGVGPLRPVSNDEKARHLKWLEEISKSGAPRACLHQIKKPSKAAEYPPLVCDYCGALTPDPWHSSGMLHGEMSKHIHSCDTCAARGAAQAAPAEITLDFKMATELLESFGGEPTEITLRVGAGHSGEGVYAYYTDIPEEGMTFLGASDAEAVPDPVIAQAAPVDAAVQQDAERYQFLRDGEWRDTALEPFIRLQLSGRWDEKIDAAIAAANKGDIQK